ncbi:MAG: hypothetical protein IKN41_00915 [Candidatus Methanomethylophilaceae archaeon]|nr:hypothetical protein [Candidatus Methanomethylophilaceae archaeon]
MDDRAETRRMVIPIDGRLDDRTNIRKEPKTFEEMPEEIQRILIGREKKNSGRSETVLDKLQQKHVMAILLYVSKMSPVMKTDIYSNVSRCSSMADKIDTLYSMGLVDIYHAARTNSEIVVATEKGKRVAEHIETIIDIIEYSPRTYP